MLSDDEEALTTKFLEGGLGRSQRRFSDEDRRFLFVKFTISLAGVA
jgi:hypothetical protein